MSINRELADQEIASRTSLIVYLRNVNNDQFKLRGFGDIVYFSKKLHYLILYVNQAEAEETASKLRTFSFVKKVEFSQNDALDLDNQKIEQQISDMAKEAEEKLNQTDKEDWIK
ncbi:MAG: YlbG family protein [Lactobacillus delbrueckii]